MFTLIVFALLVWLVLSVEQYIASTSVVTAYQRFVAVPFKVIKVFSVYIRSQ